MKFQKNVEATSFFFFFFFTLKERIPKKKKRFCTHLMQLDDIIYNCSKDVDTFRWGL